MKYPQSKNFLTYLYNNFVANFLAFAIGIAAARLVSHFFVTRSIKNLWGLAAKKTVIDRKTFSNLEMLISVVIGYIVFEVVAKWLSKKIAEYYPVCKTKITNWLQKNDAPELNKIG